MAPREGGDSASRSLEAVKKGFVKKQSAERSQQRSKGRSEPREEKGEEEEEEEECEENKVEAMAVEPPPADPGTGLPSTQRYDDMAPTPVPEPEALRWDGVPRGPSPPPLMMMARQQEHERQQQQQAKQQQQQQSDNEGGANKKRSKLASLGREVEDLRKMVKYHDVSIKKLQKGATEATVVVHNVSEGDVAVARFAAEGMRAAGLSDRDLLDIQGMGNGKHEIVTRNMYCATQFLRATGRMTSTLGQRARMQRKEPEMDSIVKKTFKHSIGVYATEVDGRESYEYAKVWGQASAIGDNNEVFLIADMRRPENGIRLKIKSVNFEKFKASFYEKWDEWGHYKFEQYPYKIYMEAPPITTWDDFEAVYNNTDGKGKGKGPGKGKGKNKGKDDRHKVKGKGLNADKGKGKGFAGSAGSGGHGGPTAAAGRSDELFFDRRFGGSAGSGGGGGGPAMAGRSDELYDRRFSGAAPWHFGGTLGPWR